MVWPSSVSLVSSSQRKHLCFLDETNGGQRGGGIFAHGDSVWKLDTRFDLVAPKIYRKDVFNIRSSYNNKYLASLGPNPVVGRVVEFSDHSNEDESNITSTLFTFEHVNADLMTVRIRHVSSSQYLFVNPQRLAFGSTTPGQDNRYVFQWIDTDELIRLPEYVAFKGNNDKYLRFQILDRTFPYLQFSGGSKTDSEAVQRVHHNPEGTISIQNPHRDNHFWTLRDGHWIRIEARAEDISRNGDASFRPVRIDDTTIALRNLTNRRFCQIWSADGKNNVLSARAERIIPDAQLKIQELILNRHIYNVRYRLQHAKIYDENSVIVATATYTNHDDKVQKFDAKVAVKFANTKSWRNSITWKLGIKTTIEIDFIPFIVGGKVELSGEVGGQHEHGETESEEVQYETTVHVEVPPKSRCVVNAIGRVAKCDVPFSYFQRDFLYDGDSHIAHFEDGIYTGVHYVDINHETIYQPLPNEKLTDHISKKQKIDVNIVSV